MSTVDVSGIYLLRNLLTGRVYVGQSVHIRRRWHEHKNSAKRGEKSRLYDAIRKYGLETFVVEILEECGALQFDERESFWMEKLQARENGYNLVPAGQRGRIADDAMRERISSKLRGRKLSPEHIENIRKGQAGRTHTAEAKAKIGAGNRGPKPPEAVAKAAAGLRRYHAEMTPEQRAEYSAKRTGWKHSDEFKQAVSKRFLGVKKSPEQVERMKAASRNRATEAEARRLAGLRAAMERKRLARQATTG